MWPATVGDQFGCDIRFAVKGKERAKHTDVPYNNTERAIAYTKKSMAHAYGVSQDEITIIEVQKHIAEPLGYEPHHEFLFKVNGVLHCDICDVSELESVSGEWFFRIHGGCCFGNQSKEAARRKLFLAERLSKS